MESAHPGEEGDRGSSCERGQGGTFPLFLPADPIHQVKGLSRKVGTWRRGEISHEASLTKKDMGLSAVLDPAQLRTSPHVGDGCNRNKMEHRKVERDGRAIQSPIDWDSMEHQVGQGRKRERGRERKGK